MIGFCEMYIILKLDFVLSSLLPGTFDEPFVLGVKDGISGTATIPRLGYMAKVYSSAFHVATTSSILEDLHSLNSSTLLDIPYRDFALQVRQCVYDLSTGDDDGNAADDRTPVYYSMLVHEWKAIHSGHTKKLVGITFWSNQTIDKLAHIRWSGNYREQDVLTYQNCQHIAFNYSSVSMQSRKRWRPCACTADALHRLKDKIIQPIETIFLADEKPYCGYYQIFVDRYVRMDSLLEI
ncbi:uncharacterized protein K460DRAFT_407703 [Cucurbitaria berberidis CBS 394.84]|uniref:Uncharacterized protein n=1 Tax=Cucurbitaria berberidis CBS 394.84 TaxID=1168544 RepID=A0A9P4GD18_9PLEO|nr:uncharacterized protein K460DRAFT_407703 [Cucurbitaria berberidis CBS 394.84]KAF1843345.1 hypothetical protein K460DRAFT_407703 [Cucurbitaria berberidis CBS 394.84]